MTNKIGKKPFRLGVYPQALSVYLLTIKIGEIQMQTKIKSLNCLIYFLALALCIGLYLPIKAQKIPIALQKESGFSPVNAVDYKKLADDYLKDRSMEKRNRLIFLAVGQIDINFGNFQKKKRKRNELFQTLVDILEIAASTAISITKGERAKTLIAEGLGFVQGSRNSINKNLRLLELQILFNKMVAKRAIILKGIANKTALTDEIYPFEVALVDIIAYYQAGTIDGALTNLANDTGSEASDATRDLPDLQIATAAQLEVSIAFDNLVAELVKKARAGDSSSISKIKAVLKKSLDDGLDTFGLLPKTEAEIENLTTEDAITKMGRLRGTLKVRDTVKFDKFRGYFK